MTVKELRNLLNKYMKAYPDTADNRVVLSIDEEGNAFKGIDKDCLSCFYLDTDGENKYGYIDTIFVHDKQEDSDKELEQIVVIYPNS